MTPQVRTDEKQAPTTVGLVALALGCLIVLGAAAVFVWSGVSTASARIAATTSNDSSLVLAASVDLVVSNGDEASSAGLLIDADGLYPGLLIERCIEVTYWGELTDVPVHMFGTPSGGTGLEAYVLTTVETGKASSNECADFSPGRSLFDGTLLELWNEHSSFENGIRIIDQADNGAQTWVRISVELADDNAAQDLSTAFWLTLEARP